MAKLTIDYDTTVAAFERIDIPAPLARKMVDLVVGIRFEPFTDGELAAAD